MGKCNNQKFVQIPHSRYIEMLSYKAEKEGINIVIKKENHIKI
jgi:putative transposase